MQPTRRARLESVILDEVSRVVAREIKDPRIPYVTFTRADITQDGSQATIFVSILGGAQAVHATDGSVIEQEVKAAEAAAAPAPKESAELPLGGKISPEEAAELAAKKRMQDCLKGLSSASGYLRRHLARTLDVKHVPVLIFKEDKGIDNAIRIHDLLKKL